MFHFSVWPKLVRAMYSMDLAGRRVSKLLINGITIFKDLHKKETLYETRRTTKYVIFDVHESFVWLTSV